ncbi:MAG: indolepyruvate oxidoreductase subunit beta [Chloroflexota bacterium]
MKKDIVIAGVGGQGIVSIASVIGFAAIEAGLNFKQSEVHGMSQRGGDVSSHFRLSTNEIASDLIPFGKADIIISVEPMESLRYLPVLSREGWLITSTKPFINIPNYPDLELILSEINSFPNHVALDAEAIAKTCGSPKAANIVILGAAIPHLDIPEEAIKSAIKRIFGRKGDAIVEMNLKALEAGKNFISSNQEA